jgi:hypothetical protein
MLHWHWRLYFQVSSYTLATQWQPAAMRSTVTSMRPPAQDAGASPAVTECEPGCRCHCGTGSASGRFQCQRALASLPTDQWHRQAGSYYEQVPLERRETCEFRAETTFRF